MTDAPVGWGFAPNATRLPLGWGQPLGVRRMRKVRSLVRQANPPQPRCRILTEILSIPGLAAGVQAKDLQDRYGISANASYAIVGRARRAVGLTASGAWLGRTLKGEGGGRGR